MTRPLENRTALLSDHFREFELFPDGPAPDRVELFLARELCHKRLEVLRDVAQAPLEVTDGRRILATHQRYVKLKYKPSPRSDHAYGWGFLVAGTGGKSTARAFPGPFFFGTGAADVLPLHEGVRRAWTRPEFEEGRRRLFEVEGAPGAGQLIYYPKRGHLHVSNPYDVLLSAQAIGALGLPAHRGPAYTYPE